MDYSDVSYPSAAGGFPPPPGPPEDRPAKAPRRFTTRRSLLPPTLVLETVEELSASATAVAGTLSGEPVEVMWPGNSQSSTDQREFQVPEPDPSYFLPQGDLKGNPRTLDLALPGTASLEERHADDFDRLELVRLVALLIQGLHSAEIVTSGIGWSTFLFRLDPRPGVVMHRPETLRRLGGEFLVADLNSDSHGASPYDADRYAFALHAYRLLVTHEPSGALDPWDPQGVPGLSRSQNASLWRLWERSAGDPGTRPQVAEWRKALGL